MLAAFVPKRTGRDAPAPLAQLGLIGDSHVGGQSWIEIGFQVRRRKRKFMARIALGRRRCDSRISAVASETARVAVRRGFERALFQPELVAEIVRRFRHILFARVALRLIGLMTNRAAFRLALLLLPAFIPP